MQRRGDKIQPGKGRRRNTIGKAGKVPTAREPIADLEQLLDQRTRELEEALQQSTATSEVLSIVRRLPADAQPVFEAIVHSAARLCGAIFSVVYLYENDNIRVAATKNFSVEATNQVNERQQSTRPNRSYVGGRAVLDRAIVHVPDVLQDPEYSRELALAGGWRAVLAVPLLREGKSIGAITVGKAEPKAFSDQQIQLLQTFADQAVIAIENVRLFEAEQQRTRELSESLEQQTATAEVLKVISSSPGELKPVFETILENATRICEAKFGVLFRSEAEALRTVAIHGAPQPYIEERQRNPVIRPAPETMLGRTLSGKKPIQIADLREEADYTDAPSGVTGAKLAKLAGARSVVAVPMLKENRLVGAILIYRQEVRPFTDKQIALLSNFAAQAVIAIENARLLNELRESLQQQTATADILKVISSSAMDLQPVFETIASRSVALCGATYGVVYRFDGEMIYVVADHNLDQPAVDAFGKIWPMAPNPNTIIGQAILERSTLHIRDVAAEPRYTFVAAHREALGVRSFLGVPMLRDGNPIGAIALYRRKVELFSDRQIDLVKAFADQAVVAIENTRLLNELRESLQQQTATADVLKVISRSTFDLQVVLDTLVKSAASLCEADQSFLYRRDGEKYVWAASHGYSPEFVKLRMSQPLVPHRGTGVGRALVESKIVHIPDVLEDKDYTGWDLQQVAGYRAILGVPLLREGVSIGVFSLSRKEPRSFTDKQIELLTMFADQAAIAMENVRLFESVETRTRELAKSLEELRTTQDRLVQTQKLALLGQLTAGIAHEIKNPLNFVNNFSDISAELISELQDTLKGTPLDDRARTEINELTDTLKSNFDKVVHHGKRADAIVKNMLQHSREGSGEHRVIDINALVEESLNPAWHGARAETQGFEIKLKQSFDPSAGGAEVFPQDIRRLFLI
jgi:two-component system, NtrC family, sensor kinase